MAEFTFEEPNEKQYLFLKDRHKYIAYGGARGGGKSWAVRVKAVLLCLRYAGIKIMILRKTYNELEKNHILPLCEMLHCYDADKSQRLAKYNDSKKRITFPNGSMIFFQYCENAKDVERLQGTEVDVLFIDEATHQPKENYDKMKACVRGVNDFPKRIYLTCNPGGVGHMWVKRLFIDRQFTNSENPEEYTFIKSLLTDNKALMEQDPDYITQLQELPPKQRAAWLDGDWEVYEGQFFSEFRERPDMALAEKAGCTLSMEELYAAGRYTHVIEPFDLSSGGCRGWSIFRSYDFGFGRPFSCGWWAVDYEGTMYRIMEYYGCTGTPNEGVRMNPDMQFKEIARIEREHPWLKDRRITGVADPSIWDASRGESIAETAERYGIYFDPGDNARIPGWMQCHYRLQFDNEGYPRMYVFSSCENFIRTIPLMQHARTNPEDLDTSLEDHICDDWRYACMSRPVTPIAPVQEKQYVIDPLSRIQDKGHKLIYR